MRRYPDSQLFTRLFVRCLCIFFTFLHAVYKIMRLKIQHVSVKNSKFLKNPKCSYSTVCPTYVIILQIDETVVSCKNVISRSKITSYLFNFSNYAMSRTKRTLSRKRVLAIKKKAKADKSDLLSAICAKIYKAKQKNKGKVPHGFVSKLEREFKECCPTINRNSMQFHRVE